MYDVFICSSSDAQPFAEAIAHVVEESEFFRPKPWWQKGVFKEHNSFLESLFDLVTEIDYAIIIASPTDQTVKNGAQALEPRDNVIFEYGLFAGRNGRSNVALFRIGEAKLMSDIKGISHYQIEADSEILANADRIGKEKLAAQLRDDVNRCLDNFLCSQSRWKRETLITDFCGRLLPLRDGDRLRLLAEASHLMRRHAAPVAVSAEEISSVIARYCTNGSTEVGRQGQKTELPYYVDLQSIQDAELKNLARSIASLIEEEFQKREVKPSRVGLHHRPGERNRRGQRLLEMAASYLYLPPLFVDLKAEDEKSIKGTFFEGERIIFLHDFTVTGDTPFECVGVLRKRNIEIDCLFSFVVHEAKKESFRKALKRRDLPYHPLWSLAYDENGPRVELARV